MYAPRYAAFSSGHCADADSIQKPPTRGNEQAEENDVGLTLREYAVFAFVALSYGFAVLVALRRPDMADTDRILLLILICTLPVLGPLLALLFVYTRQPFSPTLNRLLRRNRLEPREEQS